MSAGMRLDVRVPIGGLFSIVGLLIAGFGLLSDQAIYNRSLGININFWWGLAMLAFGAVMLFLAWRSVAATKTQPGAAGTVAK